jgi:hypothetical protein
MADPITLAAVGGAFLTEGVKFFYKQAGELLKHWREQRDANTPQGEIDITLPKALGGGTAKVRINAAALAKLQEPLTEVRKELSEVVEGIASPEESLERIDEIRRIIEAVYGRRLSFEGEGRSSDAPDVTGEATADAVLGYVAGLRAKRVLRGRASGTATADTVGSTGQLIGLEVDDVG